MASTILGFFSRTGDDDALADPRAFRAWMSGQPANDDLGLQEQMISLLEDMGARQPKVSPSRVSAVLELDRQSMGSQSRLLNQYLHPSLSDPVRQRLWHANDDLARWLAYSYEYMFAGLQESTFSGRSKRLVPAIASRMFHYRGAQAKQGLFRYERWTPGRWKGLHASYAEAMRRDAARARYSPDTAAPPEAKFSAEEEYVQILLLQRINTGNLTAVQIELVAAWLRGCAHLLAFAPPPLDWNGFWLDMEQGDGLLVRKPHNAQGTLLYLDIEPVHDEIAKGEVELTRLAAVAANASQQADAAARLALLRRIDPMLRPDTKPVERRGERVETDHAVNVAVGLAEIAAVLRGHRSVRNSGVDPGWRMNDSSESGCCLSSQSQDAGRLKLGFVLGIQEDGDDRWRTGIVRRLKKRDGGRIEVGLEVIALQTMVISPRPIAAHDSGYSVDGIDVALDSKGFDALYLPPDASGEDGPLRSMLVPAGEYSERRRFFVSMGSSAYTVEFGAPLERAKEWVWTRFAVVTRAE